MDVNIPIWTGQRRIEIAVFGVDAAAAHEMTTSTGSAAGRTHVEGDFVEIGYVFLVARRLRNFFVTDMTIAACGVEFLERILAGGVVARQAIYICFAFIVEFVSLPARSDMAVAA